MSTKWQPLKRTIERRYARSIQRLFAGLWDSIKWLDSPLAIKQAVERFARSPTFQRQAEAIARSMVTQIWHGVARNWREAARKGSKGRMIYLALKEELKTAVVFHQIVKANATYITTIPLNIAEKVTAKMGKGYEEGKRPEELMKEVLHEAPHLTKSHARLIARTETSKASTALTRERAESLGLGWYVWRNSDDERVRSSHINMGGVLVNWSDPPSPEKLDPRHQQKPYGKYHAGETFNCRCYPEPLLNLNDIEWPARVYYGGSIKTMSRAKFQALNGDTK